MRRNRGNWVKREKSEPVELTEEEIRMIIAEFTKDPGLSKETIARAERVHRAASRISVEDMFKPFTI